MIRYTDDVLLFRVWIHQIIRKVVKKSSDLEIANVNSTVTECQTTRYQNNVTNV